jgi:hypothetical protein
MKKENSQNTVSAKKSVKRTGCLQPRKTLHGISIQKWPSNKVSKKLVKMLCENCQIDQSAMTLVD